MSEFERLKEELLRLMLERSDSLQKQTFLGIDERELGKQQKRFERIRELFAGILEALHHGSATSAAPTFICPLCSLAGQHVHTREEKMVENLNNEKPSVTLPATVEKIIKKTDAEKAQVRIDGADPLYREIRIENSLQDENGEKVRLKEGAEVEVTVKADPRAVIPDGDPQKRDRNKVEHSSTNEME